MLAAVAALSSAAVVESGSVVVGPVAARVVVELGPVLVLGHDAERRSAGCWLLCILCQQKQEVLLSKKAIPEVLHG